MRRAPDGKQWMCCRWPPHLQAAIPAAPQGLALAGRPQMANLNLIYGFPPVNPAVGWCGEHQHSDDTVALVAGQEGPGNN